MADKPSAAIPTRDEALELMKAAGLKKVAKNADKYRELLKKGVSHTNAIAQVRNAQTKKAANKAGTAAAAEAAPAKANNAASVATTATAKKPRTEKQELAAQKQKEAAAEAKAWLNSKGLQSLLANRSKYQSLKKAGKNNNAIFAELKALQNARPAPKTAKKANNAASVASNGTAGSKRNVATQRQKNLAAAFARKGLKWVGPAQRAFKEKKAAGMNNDAAMNAIKTEHPEFLKNAPPIPRAKKAATVVAPASVAVGTPVANTLSVAKGQYICEKCQFVGNVSKKVNNAPVAAPVAASASPANASNNLSSSNSNSNGNSNNTASKNDPFM